MFVPVAGVASNGHFLYEPIGHIASLAEYFAL
jgi:hypothetical protein